MEGYQPARCTRQQARGRRLNPLLGIVALLTAAGSASPIATADSVYGAWFSPAQNNWPLIAVHAALTPDGRVLSYGTTGTGKQTGYFIYDIWDPAAGLAGGHLTLDNFTLTDLFCSSQVILPQSGSILIAGGDNWTGTGTTNTGNNNSNLFDFAANTISRQTNMNRARWYSSATVLMNGDVYIQGGNGGGDRPEVRETGGSFRLLTTTNTSGLAATYPRNFLAPDGRVFGYDTSGRMYYIDPAGTGQIILVGQLPSANAGSTSSAAMFRPGKILQMGGNSNSAAVIDINGPLPIVTSTAPMSSQRRWVSATVLADGRVLATGGSRVENELTDVNNSAEVWNPATGQWLVGPSGSRARLYHSGALLLPDASVLIAGGGAPGPLVNLHAEIYYPSYLYDVTGGFAVRPVISNAPAAVGVGETFVVEVGSTAISRLTLVKTGSVTHSVNMDQRFLELPFTAASQTLFAQMPANPAETPPGYYMLFAFDPSGVPSNARMLRVNMAGDVAPQLDYTASVGGSGGAPFQLACAADETLVGAFGHSAGTYVNRIGPRCVQVDTAGRWIGDPVDRNAAGGATGTAFVRTCPRDFAVSGFKARSAQYVDQIELECKPLTTAGRVAGTGQFLAAVGGTGGTPRGPYTCSTGNPAYAFTGRSGSWIDAFAISCRQATLTSTGSNTPPAVTNPGNQFGTAGTAVTLAIEASDADDDLLSFSASGLPVGLSIASGTGVISGIPTVPGPYAVAIIVSDGEATATAGFTWTIDPQNPLVLDPMPPQPPQLAGTPISFTATARDGVNTRYRWIFGDGTESEWSASPSITHTFAAPTVYWISVMARDDRNFELTQTFAQLVHLPLTAQRPAKSAGIVLNGGRLWSVNPDNDSVSVFDTATGQRLAEIPVESTPRALAISPSGEIWVTNKRSSSISVIDSDTRAVERRIALPPASQPVGIVFTMGGNAAFVVLEATGKVLRLDPSAGAVLGSVDVGPMPRHLAASADGTRLYVSRFVTPPLPGESQQIIETQAGGQNVGGEVIVIDTSALTILDTIVLRHDDDFDFENSGSGIPNYLGAPAISPDGSAAFVPSKKDNVKRGMLRNNSNLNHQNTVRAITSRIDLASGVEAFGARMDHDNASVASAATFGPYGVYLLVALETSREVAVVNVHDRAELFRIAVGRAPQDLVVSADGARLYVANFMDRTVGVYDLSELFATGQWQAPLVRTMQSVVAENLAAEVFSGKQLFYDARDSRLAREGYMSCASCHNDGGHDGRTWDLTGFGEGLRNTISLSGRGGAQGFLHWSANFDEIQDFEGQIRSLAGGTGLMSDGDFNAGTRSEPLGDPKAGISSDLDALAAYVQSLDEFADSPYRNPDGTLTAAGLAGRAVFETQRCAECHGGAAFTGSGSAKLHDVGTIRQPTSGSRLGDTLTGVDVPTLRDVWAAAPYLHDGSAATLAAAVRSHEGVVIGDADLADLVAYLRQIDGREPPPATPNAGPVAASPSAQSWIAGEPVAPLQIVAIDDDGDALSFAATGLPGGVTINAANGVISGTPTAAGVGTALVTVSDGHGGSDQASFGWTVVEAADMSPPTSPGSPSVSLVNGWPVLSWTASSDNVGVAGYAIYRSANGTANSEVARVNNTTWTDNSVTEGVEYTYSVVAFDAVGNQSGPSPGSSVTAGQAPTSPGNLRATVSSTTVTLFWNAATDNVGVVGYRIYRRAKGGFGAVYGTTTDTSWVDPSTSRGDKFFYVVTAVDAAGFESSTSGQVMVRVK